MAHSDEFRRTKWFAFRTFGAYRYMKDPVARAWVQVSKEKTPRMFQGEPIFRGPRGGRYRINSKGRKSYDVP